MKKAFLELLFNVGEWAGFGVTPRGIKSYPVSEPPRFAEFVTINPLRPQLTRQDAAVTQYRNFLVELDEGTPDEQRQYISYLEMPYSTVTSSGGKSLHFVISLETPCETEVEWRTLARAILTVARRADQSTKNPSRYTRLAGAWRRDKGNEQTLIELRERIDKDGLMKWIADHDVKIEVPRPGYIALPGQKMVKQINNYTRFFLLNGAPKGTINNNAYQAAVNLLECGYDPDYVFKHFERLAHDKGYNFEELMRVIESASRKVIRG